MNDARFEKLREGLEQLTNAQLLRILGTRFMVYDDYNYDEQTGLF